MKYDSKKLTPLNLFLQCFAVSMFSFGGGSTIISLQQETFVKKLGWIDSDEMLEQFTIAQSTPGATSVNTSILIGYRLLGLKGAVLCALATALPPLVVIIIITFFYEKLNNNERTAYALRAVRAAAAAMMASVSISLLIDLLKKKNLFLTAVWMCAMAVMLIFDPNTILVVAAGLIVGILYLGFLLYRQKRGENK